MPFTGQELNNMANAALDFYMTDPGPEGYSQTVQDKPLLKAFKANQKVFPGGKSDIRGNVKGDYTTAFVGYQGDDTVTYGNPSNLKQFNVPWKELHAGIQVTHSELKVDGISVMDGGKEGDSGTSQHTGREQTAITGLLKDKLEDMGEGSARSANLIFWQDGTASAKVPAGVSAFVTTTPTTGIIMGIDRAANTWWRNRVSLAIASSTSLQTLSKTLRFELRQLRRFGGKPNLALAGSGFLDKLEKEVFEKGNYTLTGFINNGKTDIGMADIAMRGLGTIQYDPTLDDMGFQNRCYILDTRHIFPMVMDGEDMKQHSPERPPEKYVLYRGVTWTGAIVCRKMNCHGVYEAA